MSNSIILALVPIYLVVGGLELTPLCTFCLLKRQ